MLQTPVGNPLALGSLSAIAEPAMFMSVYKPVLVMIVAIAWAWVVSFLDKDSAFYFLQRRTWNAVHIGAGTLAFALWLLVLEYFWVGMFVALLILAASIGGYVAYHNWKVPEPRRWRFSLDIFKQKLDDLDRARAQHRATVRLMKADGAAIGVPGGDDPEAPAHEVFEQLMNFSLQRAADRLEVVADASSANISVRIDGVKYPQPSVEPALAVGLIDYLKQHAGMDTSDRRRKQRGRLLITAGEFGSHQLTVASAGSTRGLNMLVEIDRREASLMPLDRLGLLDSQQQQLQPVLDETRYVVIVACPAHHGMTSTLVSLVNRHDPYTLSVMTLEEEVEIELEGVTHETIEPGADARSVERRLATILRSDPAVIMLSRLLEASHARVIADAATDVRFYLGLRQDDTFGALKVWLKAVGDSDMAAKALGAIVSQRLVRKLCSTCRIAYKPDPNVLQKLNLPAARVPQLYRHSGQVLVGKERTQPCPTCHGLGYRGRIGIFEVMSLDDVARQTLASGQIDQFRAHLRRNKMLYLQESSLLKVVEGLTSISEITRALGGNGSKVEASV